MRLFDSSLVRFDYVFITKITSNSVYVVSDRNGEEYNLNQAPRAAHGGRLVRKVKVHERVAKGFFTYNQLKEFSEPLLASLLVYDNEILSIELQRWNARLGGMEPTLQWKSFAERCMSRLVRVSEGKKVWINGTECFWESLDGDNQPYAPVRMGKSNDFHLCFVDYVRLNRIGIGSFLRTENKLLRGLEKVVPEAEVKVDGPVKDESGDLIKSEDAEVLLVIQSGSVLRFTGQEGAFAYSPVLKNDLKAGSKMVSEASLLTPLFNAEMAYKPNLHFVRKAGTVIGGLYGMDSLELLNIPNIIESTGEVCLFNINEDDAANICLDMSVETAMAWLLGFIGRESRLNHMHMLNRLFRSLFRNGYSSSSRLQRMEEVIETAKAKGNLPLVNYVPPAERAEMHKGKTWDDFKMSA